MTGKAARRFSTLGTQARAQRQALTRDLLREAGVVPVVTLDSVQQGVAIGRALLEGGLTAIEVTLRSEAAMAALPVIKRDLPDLRLGVGTVRTLDQLHDVVALGVDFIVTPGTPPALAEAIPDCPVPVVPGGATATEFMALMDLGFDCVKCFPAVAAGGLALIKSLAGPLNDLIICPTGGISEATAADFLRQPNVACVGGSWMVAPDWLAQQRYDLVRDSSARARALVSASRAEGT